MLGLYGKQQYHPLCTGDCGVYLNKAAGWGGSVQFWGAAGQAGWQLHSVAARVMDLCCVRVMIQRLPLVLREDTEVKWPSD